MDYDDFLRQKIAIKLPEGIRNAQHMNPAMFDFQRDIVLWALRRGRAAVFADCGLGKTLMQLEWARCVSDETGGPVLILAPLAVSRQTKREGQKFGISVNVANNQDDVCAGVNVSNYQKLHHFNPNAFSGVVLDESSILKNYAGAFRNLIIESFQSTPYRLACTATPAPNDYMELGNHAEFLGIMTRPEMLSNYFVHDGGDTSKWRLKGHAHDAFWRWLCSFSVMIRKPSDLGYDDGTFTLPPMSIHNMVVDVCEHDYADGNLFRLPASTMSERRSERRKTIADRCELSARIANRDSRPVIVWCNLNDESSLLSRLITGAVEVTGSMSDEEKEQRLMDFQSGQARALVSKPSICGFGMNFQHCSNVIFTGLSDSYEQFYQATRRCWRFGQKRNVDVYIVTASTEGAVVENIRRKNADAEAMAKAMLAHMRDINANELRGGSVVDKSYKAEKEMRIPSWV